MKLQNALGTLPRNISLLYICYACGTTFTIPSRISPLSGDSH
jgi:hypothetical protein